VRPKGKPKTSDVPSEATYTLLLSVRHSASKFLTLYYIFAAILIYFCRDNHYL